MFLHAGQEHNFPIKKTRVKLRSLHFHLNYFRVKVSSQIEVEENSDLFVPEETTNLCYSLYI